jgi:predicted TIM-barrel fold metal-dependent hydrolase
MPAELTRSGWLKIHPRLHGYEARHIAEIKDTLCAAPVRPRGVAVCCFPWGADLRYDISLPLVIELAKALPDVTILATHGGGYQSWQFRAHASPLKNVVFDFSATMSYYFGSDLLRPFQRYLRYSPERILFGSDWPTGDTTEHIDECVRLAGEVSVSEEDLEKILLGNAERLWPDASHAAQTVQRSEARGREC